MNEQAKRLFFGFSIQAPWPMSYPKGRMIDAEARHITLAFLGNHPFANLEQHLPHFPTHDFLIGPVGICDQLLFLPQHKPRVVAGHVSWLVDGESINQFQSKVLDWLESIEFAVDRRPLLPHVTIARAPFDKKEWEESFEPLPCMITGVHLYESIGNLQYISLWERPMLPAFEEFEHTADIAFHIRGKTAQELYLHGAVALSFKFPHFLNFIQKQTIDHLDHVVQGLNAMITKYDLELGCPLKAVSYHSHVKEEENGLIHWEMIVDV